VNSFDKATQISRKNVFPSDEAIQYPKVQKFTDKATQLSSFLKNVSITAIVPLTELSAT
jgi:hypothetical protein